MTNLKEILKAAADNGYQLVPKAPPPYPTEEPLLTTKDVAGALAVSERTIIRWRQQKVNLPYYMIGGQARYAPDDVQALKNSMAVSVSVPGNSNAA